MKRDLKKEEEDKDKISMEDLIDKERASLAEKKQTPVTLETFMKWKKRKVKPSHFKTISSLRFSSSERGGVGYCQ